ncbi:MAG: HNH endonuclease [Acidimicrobiaceae bacterium]|nr:HNH endonuclease [Acidimicrobiaceae bacterium]
MTAEALAARLAARHPDLTLHPRALQLACLLANCRPENGCIIWEGATNNKGYGRLQWRGRPVQVHRLVLALATGRDIDEVLTDTLALHSCDNPPCCNPEHLRWGTAADNTRDAIERGRLRPGAASAAARRALTHCKNGHEFTPTNTHIYADGHRACRACHAARERTRQRTARAAALLARLDRLDFLAIDMVIGQVPDDRVRDLVLVLANAHAPSTP